MASAFDFHKITTLNGYNLAETASALQKSIRRGYEEPALFWALEMTESGYAKYMFRRLKITAAEDIGVNNPEALLLTKTIEDAYETDRKASKAQPDQHYIAFIVLYLCRSPKNREVNDFLGTVLHKRITEPLPEIPDWALDGHTQRGRDMGRDKLQMWWNSGRLVNNAQGGNAYFHYMYVAEGEQSVDGYGENDWIAKELERLEALEQ